MASCQKKQKERPQNTFLFEVLRTSQKLTSLHDTEKVCTAAVYSVRRARYHMDGWANGYGPLVTAAVLRTKKKSLKTHAPRHPFVKRQLPR